MKRFSAVLVAVLAGTIVACGGSGTPPAEAPRKLRFAVIPKALDLPVFDYARNGAERAAKAAGERRGHLARTGDRATSSSRRRFSSRSSRSAWTASRSPA